MNFIADHYVSLCVAAMVITLTYIHFNLKDTNAHKYIGLALLGVDLLPASMAVSWATTQGEGLNTDLFVIGFIAFASLKLLLVWLLLRAMKNSNGAGVFLVIVSMVVIYAVILAAAAFNGNISGAKKVAQESLISAPIKSLDAQIVVAENKLAGLSQFSDTGKAGAESAKAERLNTQLITAQAALSKCPANYLTKCINPNTSKVDRLQGQLAALTYYSGHADYAVTLNLIAGLQERRSAMLTGEGVTSVSGLGADDRFLAKLFGGDTEAARNWKTLIFMVVFDFLTILIRMVVAYVNKGVNEAELLADQVMLLAGMGHSTHQIIAIMATNAGLTQLPNNRDSDAFNRGVTGTGNNADQNGDTDQIDGNLSDHSGVHSAPTRGRSKALSEDLEAVYLKWSGLVKSGGMKCSQDPAKKFILKELSGGNKKHSISPVGAVAIHKEWLDRGTAEGYLQPYVGNLNKSHELA